MTPRETPGAVDLWGNPSQPPKSRRGKRLNAHPANPGSGPGGETCGTCGNCRVIEIRSGRRFRKCALVKPTHGEGTDLRIKDAACMFWRPLGRGPEGV